MNQRIEQLINFLENDPNDPFVLYALAMEYKTIGDTSLALQYYIKCMDADAEYVGVYYHLAGLYATLGDSDNAHHIFKKGIAVARKKNNLHALSELNQAYLKFQGLDYEDD